MSGPIFSLLAMVVAFFGLVWWAYKPSNKQRFNEYARIPLEDDSPDSAQPAATENAGVDSTTRKNNAIDDESVDRGEAA